MATEEKKKDEKKPNGGNGGTKNVPAVVAQFTRLQDLLVRNQEQIKMALPRHLTVDRFIRVALTTYRRTPTLAECDVLTVVSSVMEAAQLGLEIDGILGHAYLVPYWNAKANRREAQLIPGYKGLIELARRSGQVLSISAHIVYSRDKFEFEFGITEKLQHTPCLDEDRGTPVCGYAMAKLRDGAYAFEVMSVHEIEAIRKMSKQADKGPWVNQWEEMARKTCVRRLAKYIPLSPEFQRAAALDELADAGVPTSGTVDIDAEATVLAEQTAARQAALRDKYKPEEGAEGPRVEDESQERTAGEEG